MATAKEIINIAMNEVGTKESPAGSNNVKYNTWYYGRKVSGSAYPWCAAFTNWLFYKANALKLFCGGEKSAYCPTIENYAKKNGLWYPNTKGKSGDLCLMDFGKGRASHIGIVKCKNADGSYTVIEGNTSTTSNDNGGCVMVRTRKTNVIRGFYRPKYDKEKSTSIKKEDTLVKYYPKYTGKTNSITTALKELKIDSSYANRKKIAKTNGIKDYEGTASQNTKLLNLLKQGKLIKE